MTKKTFGQTVKERRDALALTQRQLAAKLGVKASHIAYIENGHRKPSLGLLRRMASVLGLDSRELLLMSHPEARYLLHSADDEEADRKRDAWTQFAGNKPLLRRHGVTGAELKVLKQVSMLQEVASPRHFLFILNAIRQAGEE
jgi:transcriptional regulator with XRE-family HTH domain